MKNKHTRNLRTFKSLLAGALVWVLCMTFAVHTAFSATTAQSATAGLSAPGLHPLLQDGATVTPSATGDPSAETEPLKACAECHPDIQASWVESPHAQAFSDPVFVERWKSLGEPGECLICHTTNYTATSAEFSAEGVACEACHGAATAGHPPAVVPVLADTEYCGTCHTTTLGEWRLTGHASAGVGCSDCHNPHSQQALFENPDELCINCHKDDIGEHQNDIHIQKGITCVECHALVIPTDPPPPDGLVPTGHTFTITPETCVACHTDTLHIGEPIPGYEAGASAVAETLPVTSTLPTLVAEYTGATAETNASAVQTVQALEAALASARLSTLFQGGIIGLMLGGSTAYFIGRNQRRAVEEVADAEEEDEAEWDKEEGSEDE